MAEKYSLAGDPVGLGYEIYTPDGQRIGWSKHTGTIDLTIAELNQQAERIAELNNRIAELEAEKNRNKWYWCAVHITADLASATNGEPTTISDTPKAVEEFARTLIAKLETDSD